MNFPDLLPALPEIILAVGALALLMVGAYGGERTNFTIMCEVSPADFADLRRI